MNHFDGDGYSTDCMMAVMMTMMIIRMMTTMII